jgi:hypothetical protein
MENVELRYPTLFAWLSEKLKSGGIVPPSILFHFPLVDLDSQSWSPNSII